MVAQRVKIIFRNTFLLTRCFLWYLLRGKADKEVHDPKSVLVVQRGQFGDMIVTTAMFRAVKRTYPDCRVTVIGSAINEKVLEGNPDVDQYVVWTDDVSEMVSRLEKDAYDFACITGPNFHSLAVLYLAGVPTIAAPIVTNGWSPYQTKPYKMILPFVINKEHRMRRYVPREYLRLLEPVGIFTEDVKKYIYWTKSGERKAREILAKIEKPYEVLVGIMPGAGNKVKQWPAARFAEVADYLIEKYKAHILIIGSAGNKIEIAEMLNAIRHREKVTDTSYTSVDEVKALVNLLNLTVSVDTGPVFIAEALDIPTVDIAGSIDPYEMAPNDGKLHLVVTSEGEPEILTMNATVYNFEKARKQVESITVEKVLSVVDKLIEKIRSKQ